MKKRSLLLVVFMLTLFVIPAFHGTVLLTERLNKAYYTSDAWEEIGNATVGFQTPDWKQAGGNASLGFQTPSEPSPQSLSNFSETIPDDVLYYPDMYVQEATYGNASGTETNDYTYMLEDDASYWQNAHGGSDGYSYIDVEGPILAESVNVTINALASGPDATHTVYLYLVNPSGSDLLICQDTGAVALDAEIDGTYTISNWMSYEDNGNHTFYLKSLQGGANPVSLLGDYFHVSPVVGFAESFSDISEWKDHSNFAHASDTISSNGDRLAKLNNWGGGTDYDYVYADSMSIDVSVGSWYVEFSVFCTNLDTLALYLRDADGEAGGTYQLFPTDEPSSYTPYKYLITDISIVEQITLVSIDDDSNSYDYWDYIRISRSNESGLQHDGSTTQGFAFGAQGGLGVGDYEVVSDGEVLQINITTDDAGGESVYYNHALPSPINTGIYPFYELNWKCTSDAKVALYDSTNAKWLMSYTTSTDWISTRVNIDDLGSNGVHALRFYLADITNDISGSELSLFVNYSQFHSIANYSVSTSGCDAGDYLYTENGVLYSVIDSGEIVIDRDPALNITTPYHSWEINATAGNPQTSVYVGTWSDYTSNTTGRFLYNETLSDIRLKFTDNTDLISINFGFALSWVGLPEAQLLFRGLMWNDIVSAIIRFAISLDSSLLQSMLTLAGLVLIPGSTLYLAYNVKERRDEMSVEKFLAFLLVFFCGWALFLGGLI